MMVEVTPGRAITQASATCQRIEDALRRRIERDITSGFLQKATSADALAGMTMAVISGMSVLARDGAGRQKLLAIAEQTLRGWPY